MNLGTGFYLFILSWVFPFSYFLEWTDKMLSKRNAQVIHHIFIVENCERPYLKTVYANFNSRSQLFSEWGGRRGFMLLILSVRAFLFWIFSFCFWQVNFYVYEVIAGNGRWTVSTVYFEAINHNYFIVLRQVVKTYAHRTIVNCWTEKM